MESRKVIESIKMVPEEVREDICDNYCKYRETADEECLCNVIREGGKCPLDRLNLVEEWESEQKGNN